jgi:methylated-DNA-protein-cysteine methyltransferase-like protein
MSLKQKKADSFSERIKKLIKCIPYGKVATYGQIALLAGNHRGARQVVRILHACSKKEKLPWHRVINSRGAISLRPGYGYEEQRHLLALEGVEFNSKGLIDLKRFSWKPLESASGEFFNFPEMLDY